MSFDHSDIQASLQQRLQKAKTELDRNPKDLIALVDKCVIGICINDHKGNFIHVNDAYCQVYGYTYEELIGKPFTVMAPSIEHHEVWQDIYDAFIEDGQEMAGEWVVMAKSGKLLTIYTDAVRVGNPEDGYQKVTFVNDITDLRTSQRDYEGMRQRFSAVVQQPYLPLAIVDSNSLQVLLANKAFVNIAGQSPETVEGARIGDLLQPAERDWEAQLKHLDGSDAGTELTLRWSHNGQHPVQAHLRYIASLGQSEVLLALKA